ncbi:MAG TPA: PA14 domain-containing protein [Verrucomicrobiales bacterium]|nr:PA14 domain-containing protein [Verrucomicrobiales bacterium]
MKRTDFVLGAVLMCLTLSSGTILAQDPVTSIRHTSSMITIDGVADEGAWQTAEDLTEFFVAANNPPDNDEDLSCTWKALWDEANLYIWAEVTDEAVVVGDSNDWQDDSLEIYVDAEGLGKTDDDPLTDYGPGFGPNEFPVYQLTILAGEIELKNGINFMKWVELNGDDPEMNAVATIGDTGYTLEVALPWETLGSATPDDILARGYFGLGLAVNDDDDMEARDSQIMWATNNGDLWRDATMFPRVALLFPEGPGPDIFVKDRELGRVAAGSPMSDSVPVRNVGTENALTITSATLSGPDAEYFTLDDIPTTVDPGTGADITFTLDTQGRAGTYRAQLEIVSNDVDVEDQTRVVEISANVIYFTGPVALYSMDETEGDVMKDITGYERHGQYAGVVLGQEALATGTSVAFADGAGGQIAGVLPPLGSFTVAVWVHPTALADLQTLVANGEGTPSFALTAEQGDLGWFGGDAPEFKTASGDIFAVGETVHVAATYDNRAGARKVTLYADGLEVASKEDPIEFNLDVGTPFLVGSFSGALPFSGRLDDLQIYDRVLRLEEIGRLVAEPGSIVTGDGPQPGEDLHGIPGGPEIAGPAGLVGSYWNLDPATVPIDGEPMHRAGDAGPNSGWVDENVFNTPESGNFVATSFDYQGNDLTPISEWLAGDSGSFAGTEGNLDDGVFRFQGYVWVEAPGERTFTFTSDDGSVLYIGDRLVIANDNSHGNQEVSGTVDFPAAGYYPVDVRYYNGDWVNPDNPEEHGGANFIVNAGFESAVQGLADDRTELGWVPDLPEDAGPEGLSGSYWNLDPQTVPTDGEPMHRSGDAGANSGWVDDNVFDTPLSGTFAATSFDYQGNDLTPIADWLGADAASYDGAAGNLDDGAFRFQGYVRVDAPGVKTFTFTSDDGSVLYIGDRLVIANDNSHGNQEVSGTVNFPAAGYYPVDVRYFNGDWVNPDNPDEHGGANFIVNAGFDSVLQKLLPPDDTDLRAMLGVVAHSTGALFAPTIVDFGELSGDATYEFSFNAIKGGASTALAGNDAWALKLEQWNELGVFGTTQFGVADNVFTAVDGASVASVFDEDVHVVIVNDTTAGETHLYVNGVHVGTWAGTFELAGEVAVMAARPTLVDAMADGSVMYGWATYDTALTGEDIAALAEAPPPGDGGEVPPIVIGDVIVSAGGGIAFTLPDGVTADVEYSRDVIAWEVIASGVSGPFEDTDATRIARPEGYYRAVVR